MAFQQRINVSQADPAAYKPMFAMEKYIHSGTLGEQLLSLVKIRASQINGCAYCLDMHNAEARAASVPQRKIDVLAGWHEAPRLYSDRDRAAIALTEQITLISEHGVTDDVWAEVQAAFSEKEIAELIMAIGAINVWNRIAIATRLDLPAEQQK
ncbi:MAG: carboxymuconolactone decarboxylase family protein [Nakamurella sp.]